MIVLCDDLPWNLERPMLRLGFLYQRQGLVKRTLLSVRMDRIRYRLLSFRSSRGLEQTRDLQVFQRRSIHRQRSVHQPLCFRSNLVRLCRQVLS
jgi:hypothetical protein